MVTMTNAEASEYLKAMREMKESGMLGFAIAKNMRKLDDELTEYFAKRDELICTYGDQKEGGQYIIPNDHVNDFVKAISEYDGIKFDFYPQTVSEEVFCSGSLTSDQMYALMWMVE